MIRIIYMFIYSCVACIDLHVYICKYQPNFLSFVIQSVLILGKTNLIYEKRSVQ